MKIFAKRSVSIILTFVICFGFIFGVKTPTQAATVDYVKLGKYVYNWGTREVVATFLSPMAIEFYEDNNVTYAELAALSGATQNNVSSTALYKKLHEIMSNNHDDPTTYDETRQLFKYTDCQNSAKNSNKISSFYSGKSIGPEWDSAATWNREHVWPKSKGSIGKNDIMMLRPTSVSENSSRGNTAYGKSGGYYNPNSESDEQYDLRGDVALIVLYQHVCWGETKLFGSSGVMESRAVLLEWMEADPVDTWELGRNDSVESITGTRNVFVDYPELAFILFGEQVPSDYQTPSGNAKNGVTPNPDGDSSGNQNNNTTNNNTNNNTQNNNTQNNNTQNNTQNTNNTNNNTQNNNSSGTSSACKHTNAYLVQEERPSCDREGFTEGKYCPDCKEYISGYELIPALGHSFGDDNKCDTCGVENTDANVDVPTENDEEIDSKAEDNDGDKNDKKPFPWWIVIVAVALVAGGAVVVILIIKKRNTPENLDDNKIG